MKDKLVDQTYRTMMILAKELINQLQIKYPSSSIDNWQGYLVQRLSLSLQNYHTLTRVLLEEEDYITANTILRMIADNLAITKFIYVDHEGDMRLLYHYLFLLDGSFTYLNHTDSMIDYNNHIAIGRERCQKEAQNIQNQITKLPIYKGLHEEIDSLIDVDKRISNWRYKNFNDKKRFSFHELYKALITDPNIIAYLEYISQFAHGLSLYSLGTVASKQNVPFLSEMRDQFLRLFIGNIFSIFTKQSFNDDILLENLRIQLTRSEMDCFLKMIYTK